MNYPSQTGTNDEILYRANVRTFYKVLQQGVDPDLGTVSNIANRARAEKRGQAYAFLHSERRSNLIEISDRYITPEGERAKFIGFTIDEERNLMHRLLVPDPPQKGSKDKERSERYHASIARHPEAMAATIGEVDPYLLPTENWLFIGKEHIFLNEEQNDVVRHINTTLENIRRRILRDTTELRRKMTGIFSWGRTERNTLLKAQIEDIASTFRYFHDTCCQLEGVQYAKAMGKIPENDYEDDLQSRFVEMLRIIPAILADRDK